MGMEHRCGARTPLNLEVVIHSPMRGEARARVRDVSIGGMRVQSAARFAMHQPVTVEFSFPRGGQTQRWHAAVAHVTGDHAGLTFDMLRSVELATLFELLRTAKTHAHAVAFSAAGERDSEPSAVPGHAPRMRADAGPMKQPAI